MMTGSDSTQPEPTKQVPELDKYAAIKAWTDAWEASHKAGTR
jgi:hypothetical protein